ncbi:hypothetical protein BKA70DRAFT_1566597 [Coprinopsis sp. MPI-PUGE-AT-0042]|nr:hypothetical protein BKA70DRAFT_1566597 [Coprinopsis sp. MPI-PUGE-AT-0042]
MQRVYSHTQLVLLLHAHDHLSDLSAPPPDLSAPPSVNHVRQALLNETKPPPEVNQRLNYRQHLLFHVCTSIFASYPLLLSLLVMFPNNGHLHGTNPLPPMQTPTTRLVIRPQDLLKIRAHAYAMQVFSDNQRIRRTSEFCVSSSFSSLSTGSAITEGYKGRVAGTMTRRKRKKHTTHQRGIIQGSTGFTIHGGNYNNGDVSTTTTVQYNLLVVNVDGSPSLTISLSLAGLFGYPGTTGV